MCECAFDHMDPYDNEVLQTITSLALLISVSVSVSMSALQPMQCCWETRKRFPRAYDLGILSDYALGCGSS